MSGKYEDKRIPEGKCRVIKIDKKALFEFIYESFIDNSEDFFDISDITSVITSFEIDWKKGEFLAIARNAARNGESIQSNAVDTKALLKTLPVTTESLFSKNRFIELSESEIINLQSKNK